MESVRLLEIANKYPTAKGSGFHNKLKKLAQMELNFKKGDKVFDKISKVERVITDVIKDPSTLVITYLLDEKMPRQIDEIDVVTPRKKVDD